MTDLKTLNQSHMVGRFRDYINDGLTLAIIVSIGLFPLVATQGLKTLFWLLILSAFFNKDFVKNIRSNALILLTCLQYPLVHLIIEFKSISGSNSPNFSLDVFAPWIFGIIAIILCAGFFQRQSVNRIITYTIPFGLIITFAYLSYLFITIGGKTEPTGFGGLFYFITPLIMTQFAFYYVFDLSKSSSRNFALISILIILIFIVSLLFSQTRGIAIAQTLTILTMSLVVSRKLGFFAACQMIIPVCLVFSLTFSYLLAFDSGAAKRITNVFKAVDVFKSHNSEPIDTGYADTSFIGSIFEKSVYFMNNSANKIEESGGRRLKMWSTALTEIYSHPMKIRGTSGETDLLSKTDYLEMHSHVHNMYLSWLLWGGPISLISGLLFMAAPLLIHIFSKKNAASIFLPLAITLFWAISMIFDSFLKHAGVFHMYIPLVFITYWATLSQKNEVSKI